MKKALSILLALVLVLALLPASALAADQVVVSRQNLCVDGAMANCMKYNINGYNYLMLRDVAMLVNGTGSQFSVSYDTEKRIVTVVTGEAYEPNGSELDTTLGDQSASAVPSNQSILIDGVERTDLEAYNIGGHNFIKFRDLGRVLGFHTEFEAETNTAIIVSKKPVTPTRWLIQESRYSSNDGNWTHSVQEYDAEGRILKSVYETENYNNSYTYTYDELGRMTEERSTHWSKSSEEDEGYSSEGLTTYTYNLRGLLIEQHTEETGDIVYGYTYTYDDWGNILTLHYASNGYEYETNNTYDENGKLIKTESKSEYGVTAVNYTRDGDGNILREWSVNEDGSTAYAEENTYEKGLKVKTVFISGDGDYTTTTTYEYDEVGNCVHEHSVYADGSSDTRYAYNAQGKLTEYSYATESGVNTSTYTYDEAGRILRSEDRYEGFYTEGQDQTYVCEYTYNAEGDPLTEHSTSWQSETVTTYTYDPAAKKQLSECVTTYATAEELFLEDEEVTLALGDDFWLYAHFAPYNSANETAIWTSSDPDIVSVEPDGQLHAWALGTAVITAASDKSDLSDSCVVTVQEEKYFVTAEPMNIAVRKGQTVSVTATLECVGQWKPAFLTFAYGDGAAEKFSLAWDTEAGWRGSLIDLHVTGLETGTATFNIFPTDDDNEQIGPAITLSVTVVN